MLTINEKIAQTAEHYIWHDAHGYSQYNRDGDGTTERIIYSDDSAATVHGGDVDCSELVRVCVNCALSGDFRTPIKYMWTGNEFEELISNGFTCISPEDVERGNIVLRDGHTEIYLGNGRVGGARISEYGTIDGNIGDQTGGEIAESYNYNPSSWVMAFTYTQEMQEKEEENMLCIIRPDESDTLYYIDGANAHPLAHPDEVEAIREVYRRVNNGKEIPMFEYGTKVAPWGKRLLDALNRKM